MGAKLRICLTFETAGKYAENTMDFHMVLEAVNVPAPITILNLIWVSDTIFCTDGNPGYTESFLCTTTGFPEIKSENKNKFFPNPFSTEATLQANKMLSDAVLTIYSSYGQLVKQIKNISGETIKLHRDNFPGGIYFFQLTENNKIFATDKIVIAGN